ncbi:MAG: sulfatase [Verrucomicrobiota bacterium]
MNSKFLKVLMLPMLFASGLSLPTKQVFAESGSRPNIIWIFSDDHAFQTIGAYGGRMAHLNPSPNLDRLAAEGMRFDRAYVSNSICGPSRASILTGKHSHMNGFYDNRSRFDGSQQTFPKLLKSGGYQTAIVGKWHLVTDPTGFDHWDILPGQGHYYNPDFINSTGKYREPGYVTDIITEKAIKWLDEERDSSRPFMLMMQHKAPHREWSPATKYLTLYDDVAIPEPDNLFDDYATRTTAAREQDLSIAKTMTYGKDLKIQEKDEGNLLKRRVINRMNREQLEAWNAAYQPKNEAFLAARLEGDDLVRWKYQRYLKDYLRCTKSVDDSVGELMAHLEKSGLAENTIVFYSSDQGFYMGEHGWFDKRFMYEESFRTPLIAWWPGKIEAGSVNTDLVQNIDIASTFLELAGLPIPEDLHGRSILPLLAGQSPENWRDSLYYHYYEYPGVHSVRRHEGVFSGRYKLIRFYGKDVPRGEEWELFDLERDPSEMNNIYENPEYTTIVTALKRELAELRDQYGVTEENTAGSSRGKKKRADE